MSFLMPTPKQQYFSLDGVPLVGGKIFTYAAGTSTPKATTTSDGTAQPNPITLNARGEPANAIFWEGAYRVEILDALGNLIYTVDNYQTPVIVSDLSGPAGAGLIGFLYAAVYPIGSIGKWLQNLSTTAGAAFIGFIQAGANAVLRTLQDKARDIVCPEDFGAVGDGVTNDYVALQAAIDSFGNATGGRVVMKPGRIYKTNSALSTNNRNIIIEGNNATLLIGASMTYGLSIISTNCEIRNIQIDRAPGAIVTAGVFMTGLQHVLRNVTSRATTWPVFILAQELKESHFSEMRVDLDPALKAGSIFRFDYCVNNTISDSMIGFCDKAVHCSGVAHPVNGNYCEGLLLSNVIIVYANKAVSLDNGTFITISNCLFDFCETQGVFVSNGNTISVSNTWIASNMTNGFIGVGSLAGVSNMSVIGNFFVRGAAAITGTVGVSLTGSEAVVTGNNFQSGMNGGVVTNPTSQVFGNTVSGGGTNIVALATVTSVIGSLSVESNLLVGGMITGGGNVGIYPTAVSGSATAGVNGAPPAQVFAYAVIALGGTSYKIPLYNV